MHQVIVLLDEVCLGRERMTGAIEIGGHMRLVRWLPLLIALVIFSTYGALQIASKMLAERVEQLESRLADSPDDLPMRVA